MLYAVCNYSEQKAAGREQLQHGAISCTSLCAKFPPSLGNRVIGDVIGDASAIGSQQSLTTAAEVTQTAHSNHWYVKPLERLIFALLFTLFI